MNLKQLEYFVRVAELGSFSKAAMIINIAQPALSRQVRLLETDLNATLLTRTGRGVVLTEVGQRLFDHSIGILQLVARATEDIESTRDEPAGRIVIGLPPSIGRRLTLPLVEGFRRTLPKARLAIVEGLSTHLTEWIATGRVDMGLVHNPEPNPAIEATPVLDEALGLISPAAPGEALPLSLADLVGFPLILPERTHSMRKLLETQAAFADLKLNVVLEVSAVPSILDLVTAGYGHAVLTETALAASGRPNDFRLRPLVKPSLTSTLFLAQSAQKPITPLGRRAMRLLRDLVAAAGEGARGGHSKLR
ncbi:LysR family transcriptional regulator [Paramagnetospirillum kuznetsovii]|uniref:LysR family transcriptional regulator n=1 Tax=Paramagnetospirillum kuznetsovii TaxID=2053833 RepID=A0A364NV01_9PROT|nr:LysR substrate-binding domain-containing protein [Paramagnetospirillum kuznetsovii]RAU20892.1 LysR family transcriptional regulator [Paramagnetospirillum kuznetsovii]